VDVEGHGIGRLLVPFVVRPEAQPQMPVNTATVTQQLEASVSSSTFPQVRSAAAASQLQGANGA
jgi:hypothetical protein